MKKLFLIISIPTITILMTLNAPTIYIFGLITIFIIAFYVADKNTQSNDIILQSKLDNPKNPTEYSMIKKSPLFTHNEQPMVIVDSSFVIRSSNQAFKNFCGGNPDGQPIAISLRSPDIDSAIESINAKNVFRSVEFSIFQSVEKYLLAQLFTIKHKSKFVLLSITDISDLKAADKLKTNFVSNVSHELRTPLASILGFIETIEGPAKGDEKKKSEFFQTIKNEAERMQRLVNDLLSLSRVEESEFQLPNDKVDLFTCLESAIDAINVIADKKKINILRAHLEEDAGKSIHSSKENCSFIDLNRAGTPLLEIVSEPDLRSANEAIQYMKKIHDIVTFLGISDGNMQEGSFSCLLYTSDAADE